MSNKKIEAILNNLQIPFVRIFYNGYVRLLDGRKYHIKKITRHPDRFRIHEVVLDDVNMHVVIVHEQGILDEYVVEEQNPKRKYNNKA